MTDNFIATMRFKKKNFTGGTDDCLDFVDGLLLKDSYTAAVYKDVGGYIIKVDYIVDIDSGLTADGINIIAPATNAGVIRWIRTSAPIVVGSVAPTSPFTGLIWEEPA